jgi:hypothetical protein
MLTAGDGSSFSQRLDLLAEGLSGRRWTVVVGNTHWLSGDEAARVLDVLTAAQEHRDIRLTLVGRHLPDWADPERWPALPFPSDAAARRVFLARMAGIPASAMPAIQPLAGALRERVASHAAVLPADLTDSLPAEQIAQILALLRPIEQIAGALRAALQPPAGDDQDKS